MSHWFKFLINDHSLHASMRSLVAVLRNHLLPLLRIYVATLYFTVQKHSSSSAFVRLGRRWCSSIIEPICISLNGCADQLVSGSLCHNWCRRKELAAGDICPTPSVCSSCLRRLWLMPLLRTLHLA